MSYISLPSRIRNVEAARRVGFTCCAVFAAALLAGCANTQSINVGSVPDDYRTNHPIVIDEREQVADIPVGHADQKLSLTQRSIVENAIADYRANGSGVVHILVPAGGPNEVAATRLRDDVIRVLKKGGIAAHNISSEPYQVASAEYSSPLRLSFFVIKASTGPCGRWPDDLLNTAENKHYANFGCANQNNLAAQIANPADLLGPRATSPIDAERRSIVIGDYRSAPTYEWPQNREVHY
ncbi:MAG: CpaD family pilus assembly protein [Phyllobacterium sp.]